MRRIAKASPGGGSGTGAGVVGEAVGVSVGPDVVGVVGAVGVGRRRLGELALERVHRGGLRAVGGEPDHAELPDDEEEQQDAGRDRQLPDGTDDGSDDPHAALSRR